MVYFQVLCPMCLGVEFWNSEPNFAKCVAREHSFCSLIGPVKILPESAMSMEAQPDTLYKKCTVVIASSPQ